MLGAWTAVPLCSAASRASVLPRPPAGPGSQITVLGSALLKHQAVCPAALAAHLLPALCRAEVEVVSGPLTFRGSAIWGLLGVLSPGPGCNMDPSCLPLPAPGTLPSCLSFPCQLRCGGRAAVRLGSRDALGQTSVPYPTSFQDLEVTEETPRSMRLGLTLAPAEVSRGSASP